MDVYTAKKWNETYGLTKDPVREYILYPIMVRKDDIANKTILDAGCGNGSLILKLLEQSPKRIVGIDASEEFLRFAKKSIKDKRVSFLKGDMLERKNFEKDRFDMVYSIGVLQEIKDIKTILENFYFCLKRDGKLMFFVPHPVYIFSKYLFEKYTGKNNEKIIGAKGYFDRFEAKYKLTLAKDTTPYFHHTIGEYVNTLISVGFKITEFIEPETAKHITKKYPRYERERDTPKFLIIRAIKE